MVNTKARFPISFVCVLAVVLAFLVAPVSAHATHAVPSVLPFRHSFRVQGNVSRPNPFTTKAALTLDRKVQNVNPRRVAIMGRVVSQSSGLLLVRQIPWQTHGSAHARVVFSQSSSVPGVHTALIPVHILSRTLVYSQGGLSGLRPGMAVFIGGGMIKHRFGGYIISPLQKSALAGAHLYRAPSGQVLRLPRPLGTPSQKLRARQMSLLDTNPLNFTGGFGGPSVNYNFDVSSIPTLDLGIASVGIDAIGFVASLGGWTYNWPMNFTGSPASSLVMTEHNSLSLNVIPQHAGAGTDTSTFSGGIGVSFAITFHTHTIAGCGDFPFLDPCNFYPILSLGVGMTNKTDQPAPLATGTELRVPAANCPVVELDVPLLVPTAQWGTIGACSVFKIHGANLAAHVTATNASMSPTDLNFDGSNAQPVSLTPTGNPVGVKMSNFYWDPNLEYGLRPVLNFVDPLDGTVYPICCPAAASIYLVSGNFPMIADAATRSSAGINNISGQFAQPDSTSFSFPATKETTNLTYTGATTGDYHDPAVVSGTLRDGLSRPVSGKTLTFELNGNTSESCQGTTDVSGNASCSITPTDIPSSAPYTLSAGFVGDDTYFGSGTSPTFTIAREETSLAYTGAALIANNRPATLSAILKEDGTTAPTPVGRTVTMTLGSGAQAQTCHGVTLADGTVSCLIANVNQLLGNQSVTASFANDSYYLPSSDLSQQRLVFSYLPGGGAFAVGDNSLASSPSYFWGSQWSETNHLSGGAADPEFKGFAPKFSPTGDATCGATWTAPPGSSSSLPSTVPSYMAVVVSSAVTKSGSTTSGNVKEIVIVKTNPGYGPSASQDGTGTIVATLCSL